MIWAWVVFFIAIFSMGFFAGSWYTGEQRDRIEADREAMRRVGGAA